MIVLTFSADDESPDTTFSDTVELFQQAASLLVNLSEHSSLSADKNRASVVAAVTLKHANEKVVVKHCLEYEHDHLVARF